MGLIRRLCRYFSRGELLLWSCSMGSILLAFALFDRGSYLTLAASLIGATSLIFCAKGNPAGQVLIILFSLIYGVISFSFAYYGEMITYLGMTAPMAVVSLVAWLRNPFQGNHSEVEVNQLSRREIPFMLVLTAAVTVVFYFLLRYFGTANLLPSTLSVTTSFLAIYLTFRRSAFFPLAYAANDLVLIVLWTLAAVEDFSYLSMVICFVMFLVNDGYGFFNWSRMQKRQQQRREELA